VTHRRPVFIAGGEASIPHCSVAIEFCKHAKSSASASNDIKIIGPSLALNQVLELVSHVDRWNPQVSETVDGSTSDSNMPVRRKLYQPILDRNVDRIRCVEADGIANSPKCTRTIGNKHFFSRRKVLTVNCNILTSSQKLGQIPGTICSTSPKEARGRAMCAN
jgi:hypothetical protein